MLADMWSLNPFRGAQLKDHFTIIHYHQPDPNRFSVHVKYLNKMFNVRPLSLLRDHYIDGIELPRKTLFVTMDDGWKSNYHLLPLLEENNFPVTIFLSTGLVGTDRKPGKKVLYDDFRIDDDLLKLITGDHTETGIEVPEDQRIMLNEKEIKEMSGVFDFQSHGVNHHVSSAIPPELMEYELTESKRFIEELTGKDVFAFAFPYNVVSNDAYNLLKKHGFVLARAGTRRYNKIGVDPYKLNSIGGDPAWSIKQLQRAFYIAEMKTIFS